MPKKKAIYIVAMMFFTVCLSAANAGFNTVSGGISRHYKVHVPDNVKNTKMPLVVVLHGGGGNSRNIERYTKFSSLADREKFIVVYPDGTDKQWNDGRESQNISAQKDSVDDVGFIRQVIKEVSAKYNVDDKKIYAAGISNGGFMCQRLACEMSDVFRAVASVSAAMPVNIMGKCAPARHISVMLICGTEDPLVPYNGGAVKVGRQERGMASSAADTIRFWLKVNGASDRRTGEIKGSMRTVTETYTAPDRTEVVLYTAYGGGHAWPGGSQYLPERIIGKACKDFDATAVIWGFFKRH